MYQSEEDIFSYLPPEAITLIFPHLVNGYDYEALISLMQTCQKMYHLITTDPKLKEYAPLLHKVRERNFLGNVIKGEIEKRNRLEKKELSNVKEDLLETKNKLIELQKGVAFDDLLSLRKDILATRNSIFQPRTYLKNNKVKYTIFAIFGLLFLASIIYLISRTFGIESNIKEVEHELDGLLPTNFNYWHETQKKYDLYVSSPSYDSTDNTYSYVIHDFPYFTNMTETKHSFLNWKHHPSKCDRSLLSLYCTQFMDSDGEKAYECSNTAIDQINNTRNQCILQYEDWKKTNDKWIELRGQISDLEKILSFLKDNLFYFSRGLVLSPIAAFLVTTLEACWIFYVKLKMISKNYTDLPINYLIEEHAKRFAKIKAKYSKEMTSQKMVKIGDLTELLQNLYYQTPPSPSNLLIECEEIIQKIEDILNTNNLAFTTEIAGSVPRSKFYQNIKTFFTKTNTAINEKPKFDHVLLELDSTPALDLDKSEKGDNIPLIDFS